MANANFVLIREETKPVQNGEWFTPGKLFLNGQFFCYVCEDRDRKLESGGIKVQGQTAIPRGRYSLCVTFSNRFQRPLPELLSVPQFKGIRMHGGNKAEDSEGCLLVGTVRTDTGVAQCKVQVDRIIKVIEDCEDQGFNAYIEVK